MLLSNILLDGAPMLVRCIAAGVQAIAFYDNRHQRIYDAAMGLHADQQPIGADTVAQRLQQQHALDAAGGLAYLIEATQRVPTTAESEFFITRVTELAITRDIIRRAERITEAGYEFSRGVHETFNDKIEGLSATMGQRQTARTWFDAVDEAERLTLERMKPPAERETHGLELSWGIPDFDRYLQPLEPGELVVIGGYTSAGKSSLLRQVMWNIAKQGRGALIETVEVRDSEEAINLAAHLSGGRSRANLDQMEPEERDALLKSFRDMRVNHFGVGDQDHDLVSILGRAQAFKRKQGLAALGIDYLQILKDTKNLRPNERPDFAISVVTSALKRYATRERVVVFLLSGFNREYTKAGNREPKLSDLDGSSAIEKDASRVILIDVPSEYILGGSRYQQNPTDDPADRPRFFVKVIQGKGRNTGTASVGMWFHRESKTFHQLSR